MASTNPSLDLTAKIAPYLDQHLVLRLFENLEKESIYPAQTILKARVNILLKTNMVDFAVAEFKKLNPDAEPPADLSAKKEKILKDIDEVEKNPRLKMFQKENTEQLTELENNKNLYFDYLSEHHDLKKEDLALLLDAAKSKYERGDYDGSAELLYYHREISQDIVADALWGKLAAEILSTEWDIALTDLRTLKDFIDSKSYPSPIQALLQRNWLLHWGLFIFFNQEKGCEDLVELYMEERYLNGIQTTCQHLLRYLAAAVVINKTKKQNYMRDLVKVIEVESYKYSDPITNFLKSLFIDFNFEEAQENLKHCEKVFESDVFLKKFKEPFLENARIFIFENYCKIHSRISIKSLSEKLGMEEEAAEKWIVNLIRNAQLRAKIDIAKGQIIMGTQYASIYKQVKEKTAGLAMKSSSLALTTSQLITAATVNSEEQAPTSESASTPAES